MGRPQGKDELLGQIIGGRYEIVRLIGRGGMGAIYEVRNTRLGRSFAMKTLIGDAASDPDVLSRFRREADVIARIKHPNIVEVVDWEALDDGSPCMILEYLQGEDLARRIRDAAPLPWPVIAKIGDQVLSALSIAHAANIIHRDLKPQNIFLAHDDSGDERAKLLDFGVSKIRDSQSLVTTDARLIGTPSYMAPEQAEGRHDDVGPATDLWAMGTILYEMATGDLAFDGTSMPAVLYKICSKEAEPITGRRPDAPIEFVELIREVLTRDLGARVSDADVFRIRLRESLSSVANVRYSDQVLAARPASTATPVSATRPTPRRKRHTGAHEKTIVNENVGSAETVQSGRFELPAPRTEDTLVPPRRRSNKLVFAIGAIAVAMIAVAIVVATSKSSPPSTPRAPVVQKLVEPAVVVPATVIDAGVSAVATDAAPIVADPPEPVRPANKRPVKREPPRLDIPRPVQAEAKPEVKSPPAKKCDKADPNYWLCINGEDR